MGSYSTAIFSSYNDFKIAVNFAGINNNYCLYAADAGPDFIVIAISLTTPAQVSYGGRVSTPASFSTDFPNALQINTGWTISDAIANSWQLYAYSDFVNVVDYLQLSRSRTFYSTANSQFSAACFLVDNNFFVRLVQSGGVPGSFSTDFPNATQVDSPFW